MHTVGEEIAHPDIQGRREVVQPAGNDPVRATLVCLDLLERDANGFRQAVLAQSKLLAADPQPVGDVLVDRPGLFA